LKIGDLGFGFCGGDVNWSFSWKAMNSRILEVKIDDLGIGENKYKKKAETEGCKSR